MTCAVMASRAGTVSRYCTITIPHVRQRPRNDDRHRVVEEGILDFVGDVNLLDLLVGSKQRGVADGQILWGVRLVGIRHNSTYTSKLRTFSALSSMNRFRGSTSSPMSLLNISSASMASVKSMRSSLRLAGFMVVSNNSLAFISPRPLKRLI